MADRGGMVSLRFRDGEVREVCVDDGLTVLRAAHAAGINLASQCGVGNCLSCVGTVAAGEVSMPEGLVTPLTRDEMARGQRLMCCSTAATDAVIDFDYPSALLEANPPMTIEVKVTSIQWVARSVIKLNVRIPKSVRFGFRAGQYCRFQVPGTDEWRSYSMASGEHELRTLSFLIRVLPTGLMSDHLRHTAAVGDRLVMEGPHGRFVHEPELRPHLFVAGGTGLAPVLSMLDRIRLMPGAPPARLVFGCVRAEDLFHLDELDARQTFMPNLDVLVTLDEPSADPRIFHGNPVQAITTALVPAGTVAYLCGPPGMLRAATRRLGELGVADRDIRTEQFVAS